MTRMKRDQHYVEPAIRATIVKRLVFYWCACIMFSTLPLIIGTTLAAPNTTVAAHIGQLAERYWQVYLMIIGILPFAIKDAMRVANRTLGPLARLRVELDRFKRTGEFHPVKTRNEDFLAELIGQINDAIRTTHPSAQPTEPVDERQPEPASV